MIKKTLIFISTTLAIILFGAVFLRAFIFYPSDEVPLPDNVVQKVAAENGLALLVNGKTVAIKNTTTSKNTATPTTSMRLIIPKIKVDAAVEALGITAKGNMAAPRNFFEVGWYKYGPMPGDTGSAVIAGHVNNGLAFPAVFGDLKNLKNGDDIYVEIKDGKRLHFSVVGQTVYDFNSAPSEVFNESDGKYLKLITCTGNWLSALRTHDQRLVVKAVLVP